MSHFFAYLARMKYIHRWGLMRNTRPENIQEHALEVAVLAHALAVLRNTYFGGEVKPERAAALALFHDASEVITGDLATPIKYFNPAIKTAYGGLETVAKQKLLDMLPETLRPTYEDLLCPRDDEHVALVKAADKLCAFLKCVEELKAGNQEFAKAAEATRAQLGALGVPEVGYFLEHFGPSFSLTLDELN